MSYWRSCKNEQTERAISGGMVLEKDKRLLSFSLSLQKSAIEFHRTLPENFRISIVDTVKAFRNHYIENSGQLAGRVQHPDDKLTDFQGI